MTHAHPNTTAWYLVHTKPRQEGAAQVHLERQSYPCYLPRLSVEKIRRGKTQWVSEPMFPRYLFVQLDTSDQGPSWAPIRSTQGVSQMVQFGGRPAKVDDDLVSLLRRREQTKPTEPLFSSGDKVLIASGPFAGLEAIYEMTEAEQRALVLLHILSQPVQMRIDTANLRKVD